MAEWWSYTLSDFLLFSPRVYFRLLELHNRALWPAHVAALAAGGLVLWRVLRPGRRGDRLVFALLGAAWLWVAWSFLWERYATINWVAAYVAPLFAVQGLLLAGLGAASPALALDRVPDRRALLAPALLALALFGYPLLAPLTGRAWLAAESFAIMPDPTALATLAVLSGATGAARWPLMAIPVLWCAIGGATLWAMDAGDFVVAPAGALVAVFAGLRRRPVAERWPPPATSP